MEHEKHPLTDRLYDFANTPVVVTGLPINYGEPVTAHMTGRWRTRSTSRTEFNIVDVEGSFVLPAIRVQLSQSEEPRLINPGYAPLELGSFEVPEHLKDLFPIANKGTVDPHHRVYRAVIAFNLYLPSFGEGFPITHVLMRTIGTVHEGGSLTATGMGLAVGGGFPGVMFCCTHKTPVPVPVPVAPRKCNALRPGSGSRCVLDFGHTGQHYNPMATIDSFWD